VLAVRASVAGIDPRPDLMRTGARVVTCRSPASRRYGLPVLGQASTKTTPRAGGAALAAETWSAVSMKGGRKRAAIRHILDRTARFP